MVKNLHLVDRLAGQNDGFELGGTEKNLGRGIVKRLRLEPQDNKTKVS